MSLNKVKERVTQVTGIYQNCYEIKKKTEAIKEGALNSFE